MNNPYTTRRPTFDPDLFAAYEAANDRAHRQYLATPIACGSGRGAPLMLCSVCRVNRCSGDVCSPCKAAS